MPDWLRKLMKTDNPAPDQPLDRQGVQKELNRIQEKLLDPAAPNNTAAIDAIQDLLKRPNTTFPRQFLTGVLTNVKNITNPSLRRDVLNTAITNTLMVL